MFIQSFEAVASYGPHLGSEGRGQYITYYVYIYKGGWRLTVNIVAAWASLVALEVDHLPFPSLFPFSVFSVYC